MRTKSRAVGLGLCALVLGACVTAHAAAAVITNLTLVGTNPRLGIQSEPGVINQIESSTNLTLPNWTLLTNVTVVQSNYSFLHQGAPPARQRFYRVLAFPPSTPEANGLVLIPAGWFNMGDAFSEGDASERPVHKISLSAYYMETNLVTKALWDQVYQWAINHGYTFDWPGAGKAPNHPVTSIWHDDAEKWCNARSEKEGLTPCYYTSEAQTALYRNGTAQLTNACVNWAANGYRLPTEAEWEKAARGGLGGSRFPWGDTITHTDANYYSDATFPYDLSPTRGYNPAFWDGSYPVTSPVGSCAPNGYGLYDMAGNVGQLCWDKFDPAYYSSSPATDPRGPDTGYRSARGGSWFNDAADVRCATRNFLIPPGMTTVIGFRCVRVF